MAWFRRWLAVVFALAYAISVLVLDLWPPVNGAASGLFLWMGVLVAVIFVGRAIGHWVATRTISPPGPLIGGQAGFFFAVAVGVTAIAARAIDDLPAAYSFTTLPAWPPYYALIAAVTVASGAYLWLGGRDLRPWGVFAVLFTGGVNGQLFNLGSGGFALYFGLTAAVYLYQLEGIGTRPPRVSYVGFALIIFLLTAFLSLAFSQDWEGSFRTVFFLANGFLIFVMFARELEGADILRVPAALTWALVLTAFALGAALVAKFAMIWRWIPLNVPQENLFWTMGISRNAIGAYAVAALPLLLLGLKGPGPAVPKPVLGVAIALSVAIAVLSFSKSALVGLGVALLLSFWYAGKERRMNLKLAAAGAVILGVLLVVAVAFVFPGGFQRFLNPLTYLTRTLMLRVTASALWQHPFTGVGLGSNLAWIGQARALSPDELAASPEFLTGHGHSIFLEIAGGMGIPGLVALAIVIQTAFWAANNLTKLDTDRFFFGMISASLAGLGVVLTVALGLAVLSPLPIILCVCLALFEGGIRRRGLPRPEPAWFHTLFVGCVVFGAFVGLCHAAGAKCVRRGDVHSARGNVLAAERCYSAAGKFTPWAPGPRAKMISLRLNEGDTLGAFEAARAAAGRSKGNAAYLEKVGLLAWQLGDMNRARAYLERAVERDPAGLAGGLHQPYLAIFLAHNNERAGANAALAEAVYYDAKLAREPVFVVTGTDDSPSTVLRPIADADTLARLVNTRLGRRGWERTSLPRRISRPGPKTETLESLYLKAFRRSFVFHRTREAIASPAVYKLGEGYAETRLQAGALFPEMAALPAFRVRSENVALALFPSRHRDVERHRWEVQSLIGVALLAHRAGKDAVVPELAAEFEAKAARVRRYVAGAGEPVPSKVARLEYYYLTDEQPEWDIELGDTLLAAGETTGAYRSYARALRALLTTPAAADDARLDAAVTGLRLSQAFGELTGQETPRPPFYFRKDTPAAYAAAAVIDESRGDYKRALINLTEGSSRFPGDVGLRLRLASFFGRRGFYEEQAETLSPLRESDYRVAWARAEALVARNGPSAYAEYQTLEKVDPGSLLPYLAQARYHAAAGDYAAAEAAMARAAAATPPSSLLFSRWGAVALAGGDAARAEALYEQARRINPFDLEPWVVWGEELCRQGRYEEAKTYIKTATVLDPGSAWGWLALAECYRRQGDDAGARRVFAEGMAAETDGVTVTFAYDDYLKNRGDAEGRLRVLESALKKDQVNAVARARLGELELARGDVGVGIRWLEEAVALEPTNAQANAALGYYYRNHGRPAVAAPYLEVARSAVPGVAGDGYKILLADAYIETGRYSEALGVLAPIADSARMAKAESLRAKALKNLGRKKEAEEAAARAAALDPALYGLEKAGK